MNISAVTTLFSPSKADEFFKLWRQRGFGDDKMFDMSEKSQLLQEMGFPPLKKNKEGKEIPASVHPFYICHAYFFFSLEC
jgi:hypothetical protein